MRNTQAQARDLREFFISQLISFGPANCCFVGLGLRNRPPGKPGGPPQRFCWSALFGFLLCRAISAFHLQNFEPKCFPANALWEAAGNDERRFLRLRQALALPIYTVASILDYTAAALGKLAAWIAGETSGRNSPFAESATATRSPRPRQRNW